MLDPNTTKPQVEYVAPPISLRQDADGYTLDIEVPGVTKGGVEIAFDDGKLTVTAVRETVESPGKLVYAESRSGGYRRSFNLDPTIDAEKIAAEVKDGLLTIKLQKAESCKPRKIAVS